jgi:peptidoglycan/xylan/chitin deacetylase (PgdA/CDA1 family)
MTAGSAERFVLSAAEASGVSALARQLTARQPRILMYHNFCGDGPPAADCTAAAAFRRQLLHLRRHYRPLRLKDLGRHLAAGEEPPARSVAVTVDDGHANFLRFALPLLEELDIPATFFVLSELSNSEGWLWTDKWEYVIAHAGAWRTDVPSLAELRRMAASDRELRLLDFARHAGVALPARPPERYRLVTWEDLKRMARSDLIDIGSHSRTHRILSDADDDTSWDEIYGSRRDLESRLDVEIASFCFPNGLPADYRRDQVEMLARAGYSCGVASHFGHVTSRSNRFALPRVGDVFRGMSGFRRQLDGLEYLWRRVRGERPS